MRDIPCFTSRCEIKLQGQHIGEAYGPSKGTVRNLAAADALFRLYETQSVVKVSLSHVQSNLIIREDVNNTHIITVWNILQKLTIW